MSTSIHLGRGTRSFLKGTFLVVLVLALFAIINYSVQDREVAESRVEDIEKRDEHGEMEEHDEGDKDLKAEIPKGWPPIHTSSGQKCYQDEDNNVRCFPSLLIAGMPFAGQKQLMDGLNTHFNIKCQRTEFFDQFEDMEDVTQGDIIRYLKSIQDLSDHIDSSPTYNIACVSGRFLARQYDLHMEHQRIDIPDHTVIGLNKHLHNDIKVVVTYSDPVGRFIREYCSIYNNINEFSEYVSKAITDYEKCVMEGMVALPLGERTVESCLFDPGFSSILQAGLYNSYHEQDLVQNIGVANRHYLKMEELKDRAIFDAKIPLLFNFLGIDLMYTLMYTPNYLDTLYDIMFPGGSPNPCVQSAYNEEDAVESLKIFYASRVDISAL